MSAQLRKEEPPQLSDEMNHSKLYNVKLKYPLLPFSIILLSRLFSSLPLQVSTQSVTNKFSSFQVGYSLVILFITLYHIVVTPYVIASLQYESNEFNITSSSVYYRSVQIAFPVLVRITFSLRK